MTQTCDAMATSDAPDAFDELRGEVALMRAAIEGLASARERVPDYSPTLAQIAGSLVEALQGIDRIEKSPAARLSPVSLVEAINKASTDARAYDARMIAEVRDAITRSVGRIDGIVERGQAAGRQTRRLIWSGAGGLVVGVLLWAMLPGAVARALPASWHVPEWMAARTIGVDERAAAQRLMLAARRGQVNEQ